MGSSARAILCAHVGHQGNGLGHCARSGTHRIVRRHHTIAHMEVGNAMQAVLGRVPRHSGAEAARHGQQRRVDAHPPVSATVRDL